LFTYIYSCYKIWFLGVLHSCIVTEEPLYNRHFNCGHFFVSYRCFPFWDILRWTCWDQDSLSLVQRFLNFGESFKRGSTVYLSNCMAMCSHMYSVVLIIKEGWLCTGWIKQLAQHIDLPIKSIKYKYINQITN